MNWRRPVSLNAYDLSAEVFVRGLTNLRAQLVKAEAATTARGGGEAALLAARPAQDGHDEDVANSVTYDLHAYTLAAHVHWAAEGSRAAIARLLGSRSEPAASNARSLSDLYDRIDTTILYLQTIAPNDLEAGLGRTIVFEHRRGCVSSDGSQFLLAYAIPHFFYHVTTAYGILRSQGVQLTMGDFLGNWGSVQDTRPLPAAP
jgi:hypothetical protein